MNTPTITLSILAFFMSLFSLWYSIALIIRVNKATKFTWYNNNWEFKNEPERFVRKLIEEYCKKHKSEYMEKYSKAIEEQINIQTHAGGSALYNFHRIEDSVSEKVAVEYTKTHFNEIIAGVDIKAVSNALLLKITGNILDRQNLLESDVAQRQRGVLRR